MNLGIDGRVALITGGSHGIGLATAHALAAEGCRVAICARGAERLESAFQALRDEGADAIGIVGDALSADDIDEVCSTVVEKWQTIDILVNNVGGGGRWGSPNVEETGEDVWAEVYAKNALAAVRFTRRVIPGMRRGKWGRVVTVASIFGHEGGGRPWFNMAKAAQISLMKTLAMTHYLTRDGLTFNTVAPGSIMIPDTEWEKEARENPERFQKMLGDDYPLGRLGTPEEVAYVIAMVCSDRARLLNGAAIVVDGGESHAF